MKKLFFLFACIQCFGISHLIGQESITIRGKITDEAKVPLVGATISIPDTAIGTTSDINGVFQLKIPKNTTSLNISFIGYRSIDVVPHRQMTIVLPKKETEIDEIVVTAQKSMAQVTPDKTTVYPGLSSTTSSGTAYSVLKNLPGIIINNDGSIYLNGKSGVRILVNGKSAYLSGSELLNYLMSIPANSLSKIELINHPSAKYEAAGKAGIIDIHTQKNNNAGYNVKLNTNYEQGKYGRCNNNISLGTQINQLNIYGLYGFYRGDDYVDLTVTRNFPETTTDPTIFFDQDSYRKRKDQSHYFNVGVDYNLTTHTSLGVKARGNLYHRIENGVLNSLFYTSQTLKDSAIHSTTNNDESRQNFMTSLYFQHKMDSFGKEISASVDGLYYSINEPQFHFDRVSASSLASTESISRTQKDGHIKMISGNVDWTYPISSLLRFEAGAKSNFVNIDNVSASQIKKREQWINDSGLSSNFDYNENINALYVNSKIQTKPVTIHAGLRIENTNITTDSMDQSYTNLFPSLMIVRYFPSQNALSLTYDRRIDRPNYKDLNPFVYVFDSYTYEQGNTKLEPQFTHRLSLSFTIRKAYRFSLFYANTRHAISKSYIVHPNSKRVLVMPTNMSWHNSYGLQIDAAQLTLTNWFHTSLHAELVQNNYKWIEAGITQKNEGITFQIGAQNRIILPWGWKGEISGFYNSRMPYGQIDVLPIWQISGGIKRDFFDGKATLNIFSYDWFHSNRTRVEGIINGGYATTHEFSDHTMIGLSLTFRIKKGHEIKKPNVQKGLNTKRISL
ncbi:outer membrane beta-barrel protein [Thermophagus sp. OGC60D27]|uniref:outer membrane beta-barrel protein n=1 Tax=Thermophagus sp. OGC60D27 TaxID=3458415 RepID=UPI0040381D41